MSEPLTIAAGWVEFRAACCKDMPAGQVLQQSMTFYAGWHAAVHANSFVPRCGQCGLLHDGYAIRWNTEMREYIEVYGAAVAAFKAAGPAP